MQKALLVMKEIQKAVVGKNDIIEKLLLALLSKGHVLLEDIPGVGKTTLALAFSKSTSFSYKRMQFTPDVMPSDVTGFSVYNKISGKLEYKPGAALCNYSWRTKSTVPPAKPRLLCWKLWKKGT